MATSPNTPGSTPPKPNRSEMRRALLNLDSPSPAKRLPVAEMASGSSCCAGGKPAATTTSSCCCGESSGKSRMDFLLWGSLLVFAFGVLLHFSHWAGPAWLEVFSHACVEMAMRSWGGILAGIVAVAIIGRIPRELVAAALGKGGSLSGLLRAVLAGVVLDLCNHGILMVAMGLYRRGATLGQTIAFLIASPWNSLSLTLILAALIGWKWMFCFIFLSAVVALITGWVVEKLVESGKISANPNRVDLPADFRYAPALATTARSLRPSWKNYASLLREGFAGSRMVLRWILFGFVLAALLRALMPDASFQQYFGPTLGGLFLTLLATAAIEVCSEGSSPIAADLLTRANAPGNAFVFLMAGAATDYTEVMSLRETTRSWKAALALPLISTPQVLLIGWLIHQFPR